MKLNLGITPTHSPSQPTPIYPTIEIATSTEIVELLRFSYKYGYLVGGGVASTIEVVMVVTKPFASHSARGMRLVRDAIVSTCCCVRLFGGVFLLWRRVLRGVIRPALNLLGVLVFWRTPRLYIIVRDV